MTFKNNEHYIGYSRRNSPRWTRFSIQPLFLYICSQKTYRTHRYTRVDCTIYARILSLSSMEIQSKILDIHTHPPYLLFYLHSLMMLDRLVGNRQSLPLQRTYLNEQCTLNSSSSYIWTINQCKLESDRFLITIGPHWYLHNFIYFLVLFHRRIHILLQESVSLSCTMETDMRILYILSIPNYKAT